MTGTGSHKIGLTPGTGEINSKLLILLISDREFLVKCDEPE